MYLGYGTVGEDVDHAIEELLDRDKAEERRTRSYADMLKYHIALQELNNG